MTMCDRASSEHRDLRRDEVNEDIRLTQLKDGLTFGTDAYLLAAYVRPKSRGTAVDLGSGTGIIPLLCLARGKVSRFVAAEIQPVFCDLIHTNAAENGMEDRLTVYSGDIRALNAAALGFEVDAVTANPPYMAPDTGAKNQSTEKYLARHEVNGTVYDFCGAASRVLKHGGHFYCVFRPNRLMDLTNALRTHGLEAKRMTLVHATYASRPSMVLVDAVKGAAPGLTVTPPLCLWEADPADPAKPRGDMTPTADSAYIYDNCSFPPAFSGVNQ
jgi:tRNA1(Val) A37 N6-methylase TrmN6